MKKQMVYFQTQDKFSLLCGLHSLNNILGSRVYDEEQMNEICYTLSDDFINPHKHIFGGDYDINALMVALDNKKCTTKWYDRRNKEFKINQFSEGRKLVGYLINIYTSSGLLNKIFRISPRHWIAVKNINDKFYFLDSKKSNYQQFDLQESQKRINQLLEGSNQDSESTQIIQVYQVIQNGQK